MEYISTHDGTENIENQAVGGTGNRVVEPTPRPLETTSTLGALAGAPAGSILDLRTPSQGHTSNPAEGYPPSGPLEARLRGDSVPSSTSGTTSQSGSIHGASSVPLSRRIPSEVPSASTLNPSGPLNPSGSLNPSVPLNPSVLQSPAASPSTQRKGAFARFTSHISRITASHSRLPTLSSIPSLSRPTDPSSRPPASSLSDIDLGTKPKTKELQKMTGI